MDCVRVALRIRPLSECEKKRGGQTCIETIPHLPQVAVGKSRLMFTFDHVFNQNDGQDQVYDIAAKDVINNLFAGYNVTILAYGQTGSGKTYTMDTNYNGTGEMGVIPRAVHDIFEQIQNDTKQSYQVSVSFLELYNDCLYDLLTKKPREESIVELRETRSGLSIPGLSEVPVFSPEDTLRQLEEGSTGRVTGATLMSSQSSRSHAIFTINIRISEKDGLTNIMTSKFHLVDLAGSERSKKTGATGDRFKEGVNINLGLLVLGNVISQLGSRSSTFINYRDSKLTHLLKDTLGGNSITLMIACVSPADFNHGETVNTLRYADRAKKIKNRPVVNQDPLVLELQRLKNENEALREKAGSEGSQCPPEHQELESQCIKLTVMVDTMIEKLNELKKIASDSLMATDDEDKLDLVSKITGIQVEALREKAGSSAGGQCPPEHELEGKFIRWSAAYEETIAYITFISQKAVMADTMIAKLLKRIGILKKIASDSHMATDDEDKLDLVSKITGIQGRKMLSPFAKKESKSSEGCIMESVLHENTENKVSSGNVTPLASMMALKRPALNETTTEEEPALHKRLKDADK